MGFTDFPTNSQLHNFVVFGTFISNSNVNNSIYRLRFEGIYNFHKLIKYTFFSIFGIQAHSVFFWTKKEQFRPNVVSRDQDCQTAMLTSNILRGGDSGSSLSRGLLFPGPFVYLVHLMSAM